MMRTVIACMMFISAVPGPATGQATSELKLRLFVPRAVVNRPCRATLYIKGHTPGDKVTLELPEGVSLADGEKAERDVPAAGTAGYSQVTWKLKAPATGEYRLTVRTAGGASTSELVHIIES